MQISRSTVLFIVFLFTVSFTKSDQNDTSSQSGFHITPFSFINSTPPRTLQKKTVDADEKTVVSKIELFQWRDSQWKPHWVYKVHYDQYGRVEEYVRDTAFDGWSYAYEHTLFEYAPDTSVIRKLEYTWDSTGTRVPGTSEAVTDYYINKKRNYPTIPRPPFIALPQSEILPMTTPAFDSVTSYFSLWDEQLGAMVSSDLNVKTLQYEGDSIIQLKGGYRSATADTVAYSWFCRYSFTFNPDSSVDSVGYRERNDQGIYELTNYLKYEYTENRLSSILHEWVTLAPSKHYYDLSYTPEGQIASFTEQYTSGATPTRTNIRKVEYTYETIAVQSSAAKQKHTVTHFSENRLHATLEQGYLRIIIPKATVVSSVMIYDLSGRICSVIKNLNVTNKVRLPVSVMTRSLLIARISIQQGEEVAVPIGIRW